MSIDQYEKFSYENNFLKFNSNINGFTEAVFKEFDKESDELFLKSKINDLLAGNVVNYTENLAAFHPKYRKDGPKFHKNLNKLAFKLREKNMSKNLNIVIIGIGGSFEGPKLLLEAICTKKIFKKNKFIFITGSDENEFINKVEALDPNETIFIISSKSFKTDETLSMLKLALNWSLVPDNFIAITANPKEPKKYKISDKNIITFDKEIGGRYSIWSPIAEVPLLGDESYKDFLLGGLQADIDLVEDKEYSHFVKRLSFSDIWLNNFKKKNVRAVLSYIWRFRSLPNYFQQLEMESLGKKSNPESKYKKTGQIIFGGYGPKAQHSYFQLLHQGTQEICVDILACGVNQESLSYAQALTQFKLFSSKIEVQKKEEEINSNVPVNLFHLHTEDPFSLGYLISTWEHRTFISSIMLRINPFDQYGVEVGKKLTREFHKRT